MLFEAFAAHTFQPAFTVSRRKRKEDGEEEEEEGMQLYNDTHAPVTSVWQKKDADLPRKQETSMTHDSQLSSFHELATS